MIPRFLRDLKEISRRNKKRNEMEIKTVSVYNDFYLSHECGVFTKNQKSSKSWQNLFATLGSFCGKYKTVLDVGCGCYELLVVRNSINSVGVDMSCAALRILLDDGFLGHVVQADCQFLPFRSEYFDCLVSNQMIEHFTSEQSLKCALREMIRVSRNLMIVTPNSAFRRRIYAVDHFFFFTVRDLKRLFPSFRVYASHLPPEKILLYYFLYDSSRLRSFPLIGSLIYGVFCKLDSSRFMAWLSRRLWVGNQLIMVKTMPVNH